MDYWQHNGLNELYSFKEVISHRCLSESVCTWSTCLFFFSGHTKSCCHLSIIIIRAFLANVLKELLITFFHTQSSFHHTLAKVVSERKQICYDDKSLKLVYMLMLAVFPHKVQSSESSTSGLTCWSLISFPLKTELYPQCMCISHQKKLLSSLLAQLQEADIIL